MDIFAFRRNISQMSCQDKLFNYLVKTFAEIGVTYLFIHILFLGIQKVIAYESGASKHFEDIRAAQFSSCSNSFVTVLENMALFNIDP